jgi:hypothetical protein
MWDRQGVLVSLPNTADDTKALQARNADAVAQSKMDARDTAVRRFQHAQAVASDRPNLAYATAFSLGVLLHDVDEA